LEVRYSGWSDDPEEAKNPVPERINFKHSFIQAHEPAGQRWNVGAGLKWDDPVVQVSRFEGALRRSEGDRLWAMPRSQWTVTCTDASDRTLVTTVVQYDSPDGLQKAIEMGLESGMDSTLERLDEMLPMLKRR
jgi:hypothetical protein